MIKLLERLYWAWHKVDFDPEEYGYYQAYRIEKATVRMLERQNSTLASHLSAATATGKQEEGQ